MIRQIYPNLEEINDKEVLQWVLLAFLMESLEFLTHKENLKTKRIEWVRKWIDDNTEFLGWYKEDNEIMKNLKKEVEPWKKLES